MARIIDDRKGFQRKSHTALIGGRDSFMSGWGAAKGGSSYAFWACREEDAAKVLQSVSERSDITVMDYDDLTFAENDHVRIYVVDKNHRALTAAGFVS